jgi:hypothetical protein
MSKISLTPEEITAITVNAIKEVGQAFIGLGITPTPVDIEGCVALIVEESTKSEMATQLYTKVEEVLKKLESFAVGSLFDIISPKASGKDNDKEDDGITLKDLDNIFKSFSTGIKK